jgi:hypothetical protein
MDTAIARSACGVRTACISWVSGVSKGSAANEPRYSEITKRYRKSVKKLAIVRTIHSILSKKFQNTLSEETGARAAWLLGFWPKTPLFVGVKTVTPPQSPSKFPQIFLF